MSLDQPECEMQGTCKNESRPNQVAFSKSLIAVFVLYSLLVTPTIVFICSEELVQVKAV